MKTKIVEVEFYDCGIDKCRHVTERAAEKCIQPRVNRLVDYYKRLRISYKILTTRTPLKVLARDFKITQVVARNALKLCIKEIYSNLKDSDREFHSYTKTLDNVTRHTDFWMGRMEIAMNITEQKIENIKEYL